MQSYPEKPLCVRHTSHNLLGRFWSTAVYHQYKILIFGGWGKGEQFLNDLHVYNTLTQSWKTMVTHGDVCTPRSAHSATMIGNLMIVYGGYTRSANGYLSDMYALDVDKWCWTKIIPKNVKSFPIRYYHSAVSRKEKMYVFGGNDGITYRNEMFEFDIRNGYWKTMMCTGDIPVCSGGATSVINGDSIFIFGGYNSFLLNSVYKFEIDRSIWEKIEFSVAPKGRTGHASVLLNEHLMVMFGGYQGDGRSDEFFVCDLRSKIWKKLEIHGYKPAKRTYVCATCNNRDTMYIFGGYDGYFDFYGDLFSITLKNEKDWKNKLWTIYCSNKLVDVEIDINHF